MWCKLNQTQGSLSQQVSQSSRAIRQEWCKISALSSNCHTPWQLKYLHFTADVSNLFAAQASDIEHI